MLAWLKNFWKDPSNQTGTIGLLSTAVGVAYDVWSRSPGTATAVGALVFSALKILLPSNSVVAADGEQFVLDTITAVEARTPGAISRAISDGAKVAADFAGKAAPVLLVAVLTWSLAACANLGTPVTVNLANAQAEAETVYTALEPFASLAGGQAAAAYAALGVAVQAFEAVPQGSTTYGKLAQAVVDSVGRTVSSLTILPPDTKLAVSLGTSLVDGLVTGASTVYVPPSAPSTEGVAAGAVVPGPIPVPLS